MNDVTQAPLVTSQGIYCDVLGALPGKKTILLLHGGAHTGSCYLRTPDGRAGWAHYFARHGWRVLVPDWPGCGRSGYLPMAELDGERLVNGIGEILRAVGEPCVLLTHSMSGAYGWKLLEEYGRHIETLVSVAPAPPGNIQPQPIILSDAEGSMELQLFEGASRLRISRGQPFIADRSFAVRKLIGSSSQFPWRSLNDYTTSLVPVPPRLIWQRNNIENSQLRIEKPGALRGRRVLVLTGTNDTDHPVAVDRKIVDWLASVGADVHHVVLGEHNIHGNGHMLMLEENSDAIAALIHRELGI